MKTGCVPNATYYQWTSMLVLIPEISVQIVAMTQNQLVHPVVDN